MLKKCPFCAEEVQMEAIKCKHCGEFFDEAHRAKPPLPWYNKTSFMLLCICSLGPLALPLVWIHPRLNTALKIVITLVVCLVSWWMWQATMGFLKQIQQSMSGLGISI